MALASGTELGPYEIVAPLGAGGMGEVYRARDSRLGRDVALKILPAEVATDPARRQRFEREARAVAALNHPNIVAVYDVGEGYIVGCIIRRIAPGKGVINGLTAAADGGILYFCAGGTVWAVPSSGGEARAVSAGEYAVMDISSRSLIVVRRESSRIRMFHVPVDGAPEQEISLDSSIPLYGDHGGYFSSGSIDAKGRLLIGLSPFDSWFNPLGILATDTGRITRVASESLSDHHSGVWTPDGRILSAQVSMRATIWKFRPAGK